MSQLRKLLDPDRSGLLTTEPEGYLFRVDPEQVDADRFEDLIQARRRV